MFFSEEVRKQFLGFDDRWLILGGVPVLAWFINLVFDDVPLNGFDANFMREWAGSLYFCAGHWLANRWVIILLRKKYPSFEQVKVRIGLQVLASTLIGLVTGPALFLALNLLSVVFRGEGLVVDPEDNMIAATLTVSFFMVSIYESIYFYHQLKRSIMEKEVVKRAHIQSQWEGLRNQVNPHFLFNSLNTLMNIVGNDPDLAKRFLLKLSKVYRYILESREDPLIPMKEELEFIHSYVFLQEERFRGNLQVKIDIPPKRTEDFHRSP